MKSTRISLVGNLFFSRVGKIRISLLFVFLVSTVSFGQSDDLTNIDTIQQGIQGSANPLQDNNIAILGQDLIDDSFPNSIPIPGTKVRFKIGGYAKLDFIQDLDYIGSRWEFESATIPVEGEPEAELDGRTTLHAKQTRFNFDVRTVVENEKYGWKFPIQIFIEFDFFEDNPDLFRQPRLRHAYGVVGRILAGQYWSINADLEALPGIIDFGGGDGVYGDRIPQIRWQDKIGKRFTYAVGIEDPKSSIDNPFNLEGEARPTMPNFAGKIRWTGQKFGSHVQFGADIFQQNWQGGETGPNYKEIGYGLNLTGRFIFDDNNNNSLMFGATTGSASGHRVLLFEFSPNDAVITNDGLDMMSHWSAYVGLNHYWSDDFNSTISAYWADLDNSQFQADDNIQSGGTFHVNLVWFPYKLVSTGIEFMHGIRRNKDGAEGTASRIQFMIKFKFP
jgi:hypothetical protein